MIVGGFHEARSLANSLLEKEYRVTVVNKNYADCEKLAEINKLNVIYGDGEVDGTERMFEEEMLCSSKEEHMALFGDAGEFEDYGDDDLDDYDFD